jgi:hypothetical protein
VLTIAFILKPFREKYSSALVPTFVDDLVLAMAPHHTPLFPVALSDFVSFSETMV